MGRCKCKCKKHGAGQSGAENLVRLVNVHEESIGRAATPSADNPVPDSIWVMGAPLLWNYQNRGAGVKVAIIDTGIDDSHPVLRGKIAKRRNYVNDGATPSQYNSHATHVAGTLAADAQNLKGVAPGVQIYDYRVLDRNGSGTYANVTSAINDAVTDGCHILSMSLGGPTSYSPMQTAIKKAVSRGALVVVAAGNEGPGKVSYPANYPEVISVGAVEYNSQTGNLTVPQTPWFSNTNPQVDVAADGWKVYSCVPGGGYASYSGTSMATPHAAGFAALLRNRLQAKLKRAPTYSELYTFVKANTCDVPSMNTNNLLGAGFVTLYPELPQKDQTGRWQLPYLELNKP